MRRLDAEIHAVHRQEVAHHEARAGEERQSQGELADDQDTGPAAHANAGGAGASTFLEHFVDVGFGDVQRRRQTEQDPGAERDRGEEGDDGAVHGELNPVRLADILRGGVEETDADVGERQAEHTADDGKQHALDQQLPHDPPAVGAERDAHGNLARPVRRAREQQVGDVGARDEQHEADGAHQRQEYRADRAAIESPVERLDLWLNVLVGVGIILRETLTDREHLGARLGRGHLGIQPAEHLEATRVALLRLEIAIVCSGCHRSAFIGNLNPSGITPITTEGMSLTRIVRPTTFGSLP